MKCADVYNLFFKAKEVTEIRAYGLNGKSTAWAGWARNIVYGYFDNAKDFGKCAEDLDREKAPGIYFVLNPINPDLLARAANRLKATDQKTALTTDEDVTCLRWLYIDLDPIRPTGISSTKEEVTAAIKLRNKIIRWFRDERGYKGGIPAMSGNGAHYMIRLKDWQVTDENKDKIKKALAFLSDKFTTAKVDVDTAVFNPSRICKVYGTHARKGDHTPTRPHRKSYIESKYLKGESNGK